MRRPTRDTAAGTEGPGDLAGTPGGPGEGVPRPGVWVETATWPPIELREVDGWRMGYSGGFTRRGNSALPPRSGSSEDPTELTGSLERVEAFYAARAVPTVVRVDPAALPRLDAHLAGRGYAISAPTSVMVAPTDRRARDGSGAEGSPSHGDANGGPGGAARSRGEPGGGAGLRISAADVPDTEWLVAWLGVKTTSTAGHELAARLLRGAPAAYLTARDESGVVGVLRAAPSGRWVALSCLAVAERARRLGVGRSLTERALDETSAGWAFLQVEDSNRAAADLYAGLGFTVADRYHYRQR